MQEEINFLCRPIEEIDPNTYKVLVNKDNILEIPDINASERLIGSKIKLKLNRLLFCKGLFNKNVKHVDVKDVYYLQKDNSDNVEIELSLEEQNMIENMQCSPVELIREIFKEELEEDEEDPDQLQDNQDKEGAD